MKKVLTFYLIGGATVAVWAYSKGYSFSIKNLLLWPIRIKPVMSAAKMAAGAPRQDIP